MKEKILMVALCVLCFAIAASSTVAYFTGVDQVHNVITTGSVDIEIDEKMELEDGELVDFPEEGVHNIHPGSYISKIVSVENVGLSSAWVRMRVEVKITDADGNPLPTEITVGDETISVIDITFKEGWSYSDGYYYYEMPVDPGVFTETLFEEVYFSDKASNEYQECTINVIVYAEAVQTANNPIPDDGVVTDIKGWPVS